MAMDKIATARYASSLVNVKALAISIEVGLGNVVWVGSIVCEAVGIGVVFGSVVGFGV